MQRRGYFRATSEPPTPLVCQLPPLLSVTTSSVFSLTDTQTEEKPFDGSVSGDGTNAAFGGGENASLGSTVTGCLWSHGAVTVSGAG